MNGIIQFGNRVDSSVILDLLISTAISTTLVRLFHISTNIYTHFTMGVKEDIDQKIASKPVYVVSKSFCPFCKIAKQVLQRYNIPAENILIQADMWAMFEDVVCDLEKRRKHTGTSTLLESIIKTL